MFIVRFSLFCPICQCVDLIGSLDVSFDLIGSWLWWLEQPAANGLPSERVFTAEQSGDTEGRQKEGRRTSVFA